MSDVVLPVLYTLFIWWFSTGAIIYLDGLPRWTTRWTLLAVTGLTVAACVGMVATADDTSVAGALAGFTYGLIIWGWQEFSFFTGLLTGPRRTPCPVGVQGWERFRCATEAVLWHELAILAGAVLIVVLTWGADNQMALWTYLLLWGMRQSAKFNVFLGVRNLNEEFVPDHLAWLTTYFARRPINLLFPFSVTVSTVIWAWMVMQAGLHGAMPFEVASWSILATLMALAVLEHWFLVLPLPAAALWKWSLTPHHMKAGPDDEP